MKAPILFGKYLLLERINVGGMAEVFIGKAFGIEGFERVLAVKKILPTMAADAEFITMFIDEARISVQLNHANIVHIHELGKHDDSFYIAMEYVSGPDLRTILDRFRAGNARMPIAQAAYIASKICEGLDYAHRKKDGRGMDLGIIHRDVSPQNVLISYEGEVKIIDFGIAKAANRSHQTQAGILKGKFAYMSPEQVQGRQIDRRSDIFAVGNILFEMLTGERLFVGGSDFSVVEKVRNAEVPSVREIDPEIPTGLEQILYRALAREPTERYQWASEMQEDLLRFQLVGDTIYSSKNLSVFMKEAFAEDLGREHARMERFTTIERPPELDPAVVTQAPLPPPPRPPTLGPSPSLRPPARRPSPHVANVAAAAAGVEEPSISVDPSIPSFQYLPTDQTAVNESKRSNDTFITPDPNQRRRVERGEKVEIGDGRDDLIDAATAPRPAYASKPAPGANGKKKEEEPPPWPSLEGRGETVIQPAPAPARRDGPGKHVTPKPSAGPRPPVLGEVRSSITDVNGRSQGPATEEWTEDPAVSATVADMPAPAGLPPLGGLGDDALPEPPRAEIPSVTNVDVPQLPDEPVTMHHGRDEHERTPIEGRVTTDAVPLPAPDPFRTDLAIPLPAPSGPAPQALMDLAAHPDASDSVIGKALDAVLPDAGRGDAPPAPHPVPLPAPPDHGHGSDEPSVTPREQHPALDEPSVSVTPSDADALASTVMRGVADEEEPEVGPDEKTLARDVPALEEIRRRAEEEEALEAASQGKTEMRAPQGWAPPPEDTLPPSGRLPLAGGSRSHTPTEGWDEARGTSQASAYGAGAQRSDPGITNAGTGSGESTMEDEPPAWPSLEGRGETQIGVLPTAPAPKKRPGSLRAGRGTPATGTGRPKTGNFVVGKPDDSPLDEPATSAERPRVLPAGGRTQPEAESVMTDLPVERSDPQLTPYRPSGTRGSLVVGPPPLDRRKLLIVGGAGAAALAVVILVAVLLTGSSAEPVWINITPNKAVVRVDGQPVKNAEVANLKDGDHELTATAPGFRPLKRRLTVSKRTPPVVDILASVDAPEPPAMPPPPVAPPPAPAPTAAGPAHPTSLPMPPPPVIAPPPTAPPVPKTFVAAFETEEPDVEVSIGGKALGKTPGLKLQGMTVGKDYAYVARKPGFKSAFGKFRSDGQPEITIPLAMERLEATAPQPAVTAPPPKKVERGELACATRPQGAQIFVDGRATGRTTPAPPSNPIHVTAGKHKVTFKLGGKSVDRSIDVKPGQLETLTNIEL